MSGTAVTPFRSNNVRTVSRSVRRGLATSGWLALLLGGALGYFQARLDLLNSGLMLLLDTAFSAFDAAPDLLSTWLQLPITVHPVALAVVGMALVGVVSGAVAGLWLSGTSSVLRLLVALLALLIGLISAEVVRGTLLGLSLGDSLRLAEDGLEAVQIGVGTLGAMVGIRTGRVRTVSYRPPRRELRRASRPVSVRANPVQRARRAVTSIEMPSLPSIQIPTIQLPRTPITLRSRGPNLFHERGSTSAGRVARSTANRRHIQSTSRHAAHTHSVHLGRETTGVCPYCLEEVASNDPRGRVVCDICGTPHHADCWAITGKCEVPHLQP